MAIAHPPITDPGICIIHTAKGEHIPESLAKVLLPVHAASFHRVCLQAHHPVELHYHNIDEYWWFVAGNPTVTLRTAGGVKKEYRLGPGDLVATVRGVEHTLDADHELVYYEFNSDLAADPGGGGHLIR